MRELTQRLESREQNFSSFEVLGKALNQKQKEIEALRDGARFAFSNLLKRNEIEPTENV